MKYRNLYPNWEQIVTDNRLIFLGDSLTNGAYGILPGMVLRVDRPYPYLVADALDMGFMNYAFPGASTRQILAAVDEYDAFKISECKNIVIILLGVNDLNHPSMVGSGKYEISANTFDRYCQLCSKAKEYNAKVVSCTIPVFTPLPNYGWNVGEMAIFQDQHNRYNQAIRSFWNQLSDALFDLAALPEFGVWKAQENLTFYQGDRIHWSVGGHQRIATALEEVIVSLISRDQNTAGR